MFQRITALFRSAAKPKPNLFAPTVPANKTVTPPIRRQGGFSWNLELIRAARDEQLRGQFFNPVRLAEALRTDDALFTAYMTRVSTQSAIPLQWHPVDSDSGRVAAARAEVSILAPQCTRESILGTLANHGIAIGYVQLSTEDDPEYGPTTTMLLTEWPLEHVRYNASTLSLETRTLESGTVTITHGDGRWIVFRKFGAMPWTQDACLLPAALIWAAHAECVSDWAGASFSHGQPKMLGTLREGVSLGDGENLTPEAQHLLTMLASLVTGDSPAGIIPAGADAKVLFNGSTAWQVFQELILNREKAAMRVYNGTDAALGSQSGAPGVDIGALFAVSSTRIQGDFEALERGYREGMIVPWCAMHAIARADVPCLDYAMPDADAERLSAQEAAALDRLNLAVKAMRDAGLIVNQDVVDALTDVLGVGVSCVLAAVETRQVKIDLAPTDIAKVILVKEARAAQGLPPLGDERDDMTITELDAANVAKAAPPPPDPAAPTDGGDPAEPPVDAPPAP